MRVNLTSHWLGRAAIVVAGALALGAHAQDSDLIARGKMVATAADCAACHTSDASHQYAGGRAIGSPMGNIYASNITPSNSHGIGGYSEAQFADALRKGINARGEHLYPAMPYTAYAGLTDDDVHALYVYFTQGVKADDNTVPATKLPFPYSMRWTMAGWNLLYLGNGMHPAQGSEDARVARGHYLVDTLGHCSSCHSPRTFLMAEDASAYLSGAKVDGWIAPNITSDAVSGIGAWSEDDIAAYLKNGHVKGKGQAGGGMAEAVEQSLSHLSDDDLYAMAAYLKTVRGIRDPNDTKAAFEYAGARAIPALGEREPVRPDGAVDPEALRVATTTDGATLYAGACASCHQPDGLGTQNQYFPSLSHNRAVGMSAPDNLVMAILHGIDRKGADLHVAMPAFARDLSDAQVAAVATYVEQHFGNPDVQVSADTVAGIRAGGPKPLLLRLTPFLVPGGVLVVALVLWLVVAMTRRRKRKA
ncbi:cytochrome c [Luteibacter aegosomaticola]|uniref:cytochrome c n=1 Tax=Luteibacter aegosomaticola TaxID=2911538 RepID=UPI001FFA315A|nr:cytochrome c [Luteibacter aegosomaticola]UPG88137.1 cytochrome c [Luteibacter aegosomaticola]